MKELKFIHITKNAGTTIENIANDNSVKWGRFDCDHLRNYKKPGFNGSIWHTPRRFMKEGVYDGFKTFAVVRNPYDRCLSEFHCPWTQKLLIGKRTNVWY